MGNFYTSYFMTLKKKIPFGYFVYHPTLIRYTYIAAAWILQRKQNTKIN